jgi:tRNA(Arg) A34 adenosine deaminase TadA
MRLLPASLILLASALVVSAAVPVAFPDDATCTVEDRTLIARTYELARASSLKGDGGHGALLLKDGKVLAEFSSATNSTGDATKHAETGLISLVARKYGLDIFKDAILYTSEEPCIMCCGSVRSAGLRTFVYGTTAAQARRISGRPLPDRLLECREIYARLEYPIAIRGPLMEAEGLTLLAEHHDRRTAAK